MPPKKNKQREKQEQNRASSSARAKKSLLSTSSAFGGFIGFSSFAQSTPQATAETDVKPVMQSIYNGSDHQIALALKMLAKKDVVTKVKALQMFLHEVLPFRTPVEIRPMLGHFTQLYTFEMRDQNDRKVRHLLNELLAALTANMRPRAFVPHLQRLLPYWYLALHDVNADVAVLAKKAFNTLFPETSMQKSVLQEHLAAMMKEFETFFRKTPDTFDGIPLQSDEKEERYERCIASAVLSIDAVVKFFAEQQMLDVLSDENASCTVASVVLSDKFTHLAIASSKHPIFSRDIVRRAMYMALVTLSTNAKAIVTARLEAYGKVVLGTIRDKSPANHDVMWNAVLTFLQNFPDVWHTSSSFCKFVVSAVYPQLFAQIRHGYYGSSRSSFPTLLPFLSMVPLSVAIDPSSSQSALYTGVLEECSKFIASKDARFSEPPAITAFFDCIAACFSIFLSDDANAAWLKEQNAERFEVNYVNQFEKIFVSLLNGVLCSRDFPDGEVATFASSMLKMSSRLRSFSTNSSLVKAVKDNFAEKIHVWTRQSICLMVSKLSFVPSRISTLINAGVSDANCRLEDHEATQWLSTSKELYRQYLDQLDALMVETFSSSKTASIALLLAGINGVCKIHSLELVLLHGANESIEGHFDAHYRPFLRTLADSKKSSADKEVVSLMRIMLEISRVFLLSAKDKKQFLLQLFKDCNVQFGDLEETGDIIQNGLQFPISEQSKKLWLSCGSWENSHDGGVLPSDQSNSTLTALQTIWQGKLLDEFLITSLKGRLDDVDGSAFATFLNECLGGMSNNPVVSPDAVVIVCHFVLQKGCDCSDAVVVQMLARLCELFLKLNGELPAELEAVEGQLYKLLFHLSAQGSYRAEASKIWAQTVSFSLKRWTLTRTETLLNELAAHINDYLLSDVPAGAVSFNSKQFAAYIKSYVQLGADQVFLSEWHLVEKLDAIYLRCPDDSRQHLFYSRVLEALGDVCEDEQLVNALQAYFSALTLQNESFAVAVVAKLVDLDVTYALTWIIFHSCKDYWKSIELAEVIENYLTLDRLYEALKMPSGIMDEVLANALARCQRKDKPEYAKYRDLVFLDENQNLVASENLMLLTLEQHKKIDEMMIEVLSLFTTAATRCSIIQELVDQNCDWKQKVTQIVAFSLFSEGLEDTKVGDEAIATLQRFFALCDREIVNDPMNGLFEYMRLVSRAVNEQRKIPSHTKPEIILLPTQESIMLRLVEMLASNSSTIVEIDEWIVIAEYISLLSVYLDDATPDFCNTWKCLVHLIVTHAIAGKSETAKIAALKIQKHNSVVGVRRNVAASDENQIVLAQSNELVIARLALMNLVSAVYSSNPDVLQVLSAPYREALLSTVLCGLSEGSQLKASFERTYLSLASPSQRFQLVNLWLNVENLLALALSALRATLASIYDAYRVNQLVLESFGGMNALASLFNGNRYPLHPSLRILLYIVASYSGAFRLHTYDTSTIDVNAEDEAATESALAKIHIPKGLRSALRAIFADGISKTSSTNRRIGRGKQEMQESDDVIGKLLLWDLFLQLFPSSGAGESSSDGEGARSALIASSLSWYVSRHGMLNKFLSFSAAFLFQESQSFSKIKSQELQDAVVFDVKDLDRSAEDEMWSLNKMCMFQLGTRVLFRTVVRLPAIVRSWWNDECSRATRSWAAKYFEDFITPSVLAAELQLIQKASENTLAFGESLVDGQMTVKGSRVSREITTTYMKDECALEMVMRVPPSYPLRCVEVECTKRIGIPEDRWRRWVLQIVRVASSRDGSLLVAVLLWKHNMDKEFEGVEPCPICYSIMNPKNMSLPTLACKTCTNKYHNSCLYKWFNQSGKNKCPICQQPFS
ncbi:hypothetical protein PsorP6_008783 [Peronosclerospora sorghi]|uniref:Uncharacterized protein n=1 Tax=Peronosclerospora sorghi TaxID=230839 RepID=A0ACC0VYU2_9STRA|nr:hypothetical protein PsorP6_008783 [Peronosclerospora sorghi]